MKNKKGVDTLDFRTYLYNNTMMSDGTIRLYTSLVNSCIDIINKSIELDDINIINQYLIKKNREFNNIAFKYAVINFLKFKNKKEWITDLVKIKKPIKKKMGHWLSLEEVEYLISNLPLKCKVAFTIQYETGLRIREVLGLKKDNVELLKDKARIMVGTKTKQTLNKFITIPTYNMLMEFMGGVSDYFFITKTTNDYEVNIRSTYNRFSEVFKETALRVLDKDINTHDIRRSVAMWIVKQDNSINGLYKAQRFLGHTNTTTTFKYLSENNMLDN
jgi:integrase